MNFFYEMLVVLLCMPTERQKIPKPNSQNNQMQTIPSKVGKS